MKKIYIISLFIYLSSSLQAQFVDIPDANFRKRLIELCPTCFNANKQMDTTCNGVVNLTDLDVSQRNINNLFGVQFFDKLTTLVCNSNQLTGLPKLPSNLVFLYCDDNQLTSLPTLPKFLAQLSCSDNQLTILPTLPLSLTRLWCFNNQLTSLPKLPNNLYFLNCSSNQLTSLPTLPSSLDDLTCNSNQLTSLPTLPSRLIYLYCYDNQLANLPTLPDNLMQLLCYKNQIKCLPFLPSTLTQLYFNKDLTMQTVEGNLINCLPNKPSGIVSAYNSFPICNASNNPNNCNLLTGLETKNFTEKLTLYPNPTSSEVILSENGAIEVYSLTGNLMLLCKVENNSINISSLAKGIYHLKLTTPTGQRKTVKLVKE